MKNIMMHNIIYNTKITINQSCMVNSIELLMKIKHSFLEVSKHSFLEVSKHSN